METNADTTFEFDVTFEELLYAEGAAGLNEILDERMADQGIQHTATDIGYQVIKHTPGEEGTSGLITIIATYIPDYEAEDDYSFGDDD